METAVERKSPRLCGDSERLLVKVDGLNVLTEGAVGMANITVIATLASSIGQVLRDDRVVFVDFESGVVLAQLMVDDSNVRAGTAFRRFVFRLQRVIQLLLVVHFSLSEIVLCAGRMA